MNEELFPMAFLPAKVLRHQMLMPHPKLLYAHLTSLLEGRTWVGYEEARETSAWLTDQHGGSFWWMLRSLDISGLIRIDDLGEEGKRIYLVDFEANPADEDEY